MHEHAEYNLTTYNCTRTRSVFLSDILSALHGGIQERGRAVTKKILIMRIGLVVLSLFIITGVVLMASTMAENNRKNTISIRLEEGKTEELEFEDLCLIPGESTEYVVKIRNYTTDNYDLKLDFIETEERTLKNYLRVKIEADGKQVCDELLCTVFDKDLNIPIDSREKKTVELHILYYLPYEVGNEAEETEALFKLEITARSNKR